MTDIAAVLAEIAEEMRDAPHRGTVAGYIPPLAAVSPARFGMAVALADGTLLQVGDAQEPFSIQSISKVFLLAMAMGTLGDKVWERIGREPSGSAFNSIVQLEAEHGIPRNPFINAGAIVLADILLAGHTPGEAIGGILRFVRMLAADEGVAIDRAVAEAERATGFRNVALANYMKAFGNIGGVVDLVLAVYMNACAITMSCGQLAQAGRFLMYDGALAPGGPQMVAPRRARRLLSLMMTCGNYDNSGEFAFRVGLPGKSGVGGGILAVAPGVASIAVWSPGLNARGNSQLGMLALERLTRATGWSVFAGHTAHAKVP